MSKPKKLTKDDLIKISELKELHKRYEEKRERNINKYILPLSTKLEKLRLKIDSIEFD